MKSGKQYVVPFIAISLLLALFVFIGWLAFLFFNTLKHETAPVVPFYSVTTAAVHRASRAAPLTHDHVTLPEGSDDALDRTETTTAPNTTLPTHTAPAACTHFDAPLASRAARDNPMEYRATFAPDHVTILLLVPPSRDTQDSEGEL